MKRISLFIIATIVAFSLSQLAYAQVEDVTKILEQITSISYQYDSFGTQIGGTQSTFTRTQVENPENPGAFAITESTQTRTLGFAGGRLVTKEALNQSLTTQADGSESYNSTLSVYSHNLGTGVLEGVAGSGELWSQDIEENGGKRTQGIITLTYAIRDGQPVLLSQSSEGEVLDNEAGNNQVLSAFSNLTTNAYTYAGGEWVTTETIRKQTSEDTYGNTTQETTTTTTYNRNELGIIDAPMLQTRTGLQLSLGDIGPDGRAALQFEIKDYAIIVGYSDTQGYYVSDESYRLSLMDTDDPGTGDPLGDVPPAEAILSSEFSVNTNATSSLSTPSDGPGVNTFWISVTWADGVEGNENFIVSWQDASGDPYSFQVVDDGTEGTVWVNIGTVDVNNDTQGFSVGSGTTGVVIQFAALHL